MDWTGRVACVCWALGGLVLGMAATRNWHANNEIPPLFAVATHGGDNCAVATGQLDENVEAVYFLDFLTGDLRAAALNVNSGKFGSLYQHNVMGDLNIPAEVKNPRFLLVTGASELKRGPTRFRPSQSTVYVIEVNSGAMAAYSLPIAPGAQPGGQRTAGGFFLLDQARLRGFTNPMTETK